MLPETWPSTTQSCCNLMEFILSEFIRFRGVSLDLFFFFFIYGDSAAVEAFTLFCALVCFNL